MDQKERLNFYKDLYYRELERKDRLTANIAWPSGILSLLLSTTIYYLFTHIADIPQGWHLFFAIALSGMIGAALLTLFHLVRPFFLAPYKSLPNSQELETYWQQIKAYYETYPADRSGDQDFEDSLLRYFCECNARNNRINNQKGECLHKANLSLAAAIVFALLAIAPPNINAIGEIYSRIFHPQKETRRMESQKPTPPPPPSPPPVQEIREDDSPRQPKNGGKERVKPPQ